MVIMTTQRKEYIFKIQNKKRSFLGEYCHLSNIRQEERSFRRRLTENPYGINDEGFRQYFYKKGVYRGGKTVERERSAT
jgi:hypothetical protein